MYTHLLVPIDGSALSHAALKDAARLAKTLGAKITVLNVQAEYPPALIGDIPHNTLRKEFEAQYASRANDILVEAVAEIERVGVECRRIVGRSSHPWEIIIKTAEGENCDLVFMASHGRRGLAGVLIGSETQKVLTHSKIPVLVYR